MNASLTSWIDEERAFFERWGLRTGPGRTDDAARGRGDPGRAV